MVKKEETQVYRIFISCPNDLSAEKQALDEEIRKYNNTSYKAQGIRIDVLMWESLSPKSGISAQSIINDAIDDYDIYIGVMGARFGSPTQNADSGTEEEYNRALLSYKENPDSMHVAFFFKKVSIDSDSTDDELEQFSKVRTFKKKVQENALSKDFVNENDFVNEAMTLIAGFITSAQQNVHSVEQQQLVLLADVPNETAFSIDNDFYNTFLNSTGVDISNGNVKNITLEDIYVPLDFRVMDDARKEGVALKNEETINSGKMTQCITSPVQWIVAGDEKSGKTSFAKNLFIQVHSQGFIPVFLTGKDVKSLNIKDLTKKVNSAVADQYSSDSLSAFLEQPKEKIVLIIDDYQQSTLNVKYKTRLLKLINNSYPNVVCVVDTVFEIAATTSTESEYIELSEYKKFRLKDTGHKIRFSIIEKWNALGRQESINPEELDRQNQSVRQIIDQIVCTNFVPCTPFFVLVFLQAIEAGSAEKLSERSFVRYYQFLIDSHLLKNIPDKEIIEVYYALLPEIAYAIFKSDNDSLSFEELSYVIDNYANLKGISRKDVEQLKLGLVQNSILEKNADEYSFRQPYAYYYFLSFYLNQNFSNALIKKQVAELCQHLYIRHNADIIIFLAYHTNDTFILDEITALANNLFKEHVPFNYDKDKNTPINQLVSEGPKLVVDHENSRDIHREGLARIDDIEDSIEKKPDECVEKLDDIDELDFSAQLNLTFKVSQILGQLLKNNHVRLDKAHKESICLTVYNLILRCLNVIISDFSDNIDELAAQLQEFDKDIKSQPDAHKALFKFVSFITYAFIKNGACFVGAEKLEEIYKGAEKSTNSLAIKVINMAIKLDYFKELPIADLKNTCLEVNDNVLAETCLRMLVGNRMYVRPIDDHSKRQQVCDLVGLSHKKQLLQSAKQKAS